MRLSSPLLVFLFLSVTAVFANSPGEISSSRPCGFVHTIGQNFAIESQAFFFAGTNAYWFQFLDNFDDVENAMDQAVKAGIRIIRTWGFRDLNVTNIPGGLPKYGVEGADPSIVYFQSWENGVAIINEGENGLGRFDMLIRLAEQKGIKLLLPLTNNWADYGGMDVYTVNLGYKYHDDFFRVPKIKAAFKKYIEAVVTRYRSSPAVFAWELGNEPRCGADSGRNLPRSPNCTPTMVIEWAKEISAYIKSLDPWHLVGVGDEGFFNEPWKRDWPYNGTDGVDTEALTKIETIDFGTFHTYPHSWRKTPEWAQQWHIGHAALQRRVNKPVISEEYGWLSPEKSLEELGEVSNYTRLEVIGPWQEIIYKEGIAGDMYWQFGVSGLSFGNSTDDGLTIYLDSPEAKELVYDHVQKMNRPA